jgi:predicted Zn-ribbon and HTH transcriptional regulator
MRLTDTEYAHIKSVIKKLRSESKMKDSYPMTCPHCGAKNAEEWQEQLKPNLIGWGRKCGECGYEDSGKMKGEMP